MKTIILTQDYQIFFGKESGTVGNCMIKPNAELMGILQKYSCTMTVFWDVLHYYTRFEKDHSSAFFLKKFYLMQ